MKNLKKVFFGMMAGFAMCACSSDNEVTPTLPEDQGDGFFMNLDIQMPNGIAGSRSETTDDGGSTSGTEIGSDAENTVSSALVILAASKDISADMPQYGFIAAGEVRSNNITNLTSAQSKAYRATASIQKENLNKYYSLIGTVQDNPEVYVFVFCNPTRQLIDAMSNKEFGEANWINMTCEVLQGGTGAQQNLGIWGTNSFLMNNVNVVSRMLPKNILDWEKFNNVNNPFHLSQNNEEVSVDNSAENVQKPGGVVKVERSVARFDFKDGSNNNSTYPVLYHSTAHGTDTKDADEVAVVNVQLQKMALVNMSKSFYYLPRVSDNGQLDGANYKLCGAEKPWTRVDGVYTGGNYVVGPNASAFNTGVSTGFSTYFNYPFFNDNGSFNNATMASNQWDVYKVEDVLSGRGDLYEGVAGAPSTPGTYKVWRYLTENVIPHDTDNQVNGISTGVLFKAQLQGAATAASAPAEAWEKANIENLALCLNGKAFAVNGISYTGLKGNSHDDPILYYINGHLYLTWLHMRQAAIQASVTIGTNNIPEINRSNSLYKAVFGDGPIPDGNVYIDGDDEKEFNDPMWTADNELWKISADYAWTVWNDADKPTSGELIDKMRAAVTGAGITIYQSSTDDAFGAGYYCYYYYWNRHNDNGIPGVMGPMEFDVVRNNVYKLSVDKISRLGHPRIPENDPNTPTPGTPDESDEIYLDVTVLTVPWGVRVNSIEF